MYTGRKYYFITIAETLNITQAARQLMVSQPSLTQYLNKLEKDMELVLIDRSYSPLRLTEAVRLYYEYLVKARKDEEALHIALQKLKAQSQRPLMISDVQGVLPLPGGIGGYAFKRGRPRFKDRDVQSYRHNRHHTKRA